jgi:glycosyltransferase involved in cell wall biosynthesis
MEAVLARVSSAFDTTLFAVNHRGAVPAGRAYAVRGNELPGDVYGCEQLPALLAELEPAVVLVQGNSRAYLMHRAALEPYRERHPDARIVVYCPVDWPQQPPAVPLSLAPVDLLVMYTLHGLATMEGAFEAVGARIPPTAIIPHGVDADAFAPLVPGDRAASRGAARQRLPGHGIDIAPDAFVVLNANRNQKRKRVELTMRGFAQFARGRPSARLYLHMGMRDLGCDVLGLADELGIADRLITTTRSAAHPRVPDAQLNLIYNACDVGLNTAAAEGFGLVSLEHAAAGAAQVVPDHGACAELWGDAGVLAAPAAVAGALGRLHDDPLLLEEVSAQCHARATAPGFSWGEIAERWEEELVGVLGTRDRRQPVRASSI